MTYEDLIKAWGSKSKKVIYKNHVLWVRAVKRAKDSKVLYRGVTNYCLARQPYFKVTSFESIHYDKVISRFERFINEYCTDWSGEGEGYPDPLEYRGYRILIRKEKNKEFYLGIVRFHKDSTYKHLADTREEVERCCKNRIGKVVYEKEKVTKGIKMTNSKQEKINQIQIQIDRLQQELEKVKKEKDTWTYKGIVLEYGTDDEELETGYSVGRIKNAPKEAEEFYGKIERVVKSDLEAYIDELEKSTNLYLKLTGQEIAKGKIDVYPE